MKPKFLSIFAAGLLLASCSGPSYTSVAKSNEPATEIPGVSTYALGTPVSYKNVTVIPVNLTTKRQNLGEEYVSLTEAKKNGWIEITEIPGQQEVNRLTVRNNGPKAIMLIGGDLLLGGKQDRIVAKDTIVPPHSQVDVSVFCVEHDRWSPTFDKFKAGDTAVPQSIRTKATFQDQGQVWDGVAEYNRKANASPDTSSVMGGLALPAVQQNVNEGLEALLKQLSGKTDMVGLVFVQNGRLVTFELFGSNALYKASETSLLRGFLAEGAVGDQTTSPKVDLDEAAGFVAKALKGEREQRAISGLTSDWGVSAGDVMGREATAPGADAKAATSGQGFIHGTYAPEH